MKQLLNDIIGFITTLDFIDILLYFAVLVLIVLVVSLIYVVRNSDEDEEYEEPSIKTKPSHNINKDELDLQEVMTQLNDNNPPIAELSNYETEQEEKAIISYEELLKKSKTGILNYQEEDEENEEISIKKINLDQLAKKKVEEAPKKEHILFRYEKEEAFLQALQSLNQMLN